MKVTLKERYDASQPVERTTSQHGAVKRETPAKELGVGHGPKVARGMLDQFALGANIADAFNFGTGAGIGDGDTSDNYNEGSQSRDKREDPHGLCISKKECGWV